MARYRPIYIGIWDDEDEFLEYSDAQKVLFFYLITNDSCTVSGISKVSYRKVSAVLGWSVDKLKKNLGKLEPNVFWDCDTNMVFVKNFLKYNGLKHGNPKYIKASIERESDLYSTSLWHWFNLTYPNLLVTYSKPSEGLSNSNSNNNSKSLTTIDRTEPKVVVELSEFEKAMASFDEMRKKIKKPLTENAKDLILNELKKLAPDDEAKQIEILNKSTMNSWQGVFPLKGGGGLEELKLG